MSFNSKNILVCSMLLVMGVLLFFGGLYIGTESITLFATPVEASVPIPIPEKVVSFEDTLNDPVMMKQYIMSKNPSVYNELADIIVTEILEQAEKHNLPPVFILNIAKIESDYNVTAVSGKGAMGLMQIYPPVWLDDKTNKHNIIKNGICSNKTELFHPRKNIQAGAFILGTYMEECLRMEPSNFSARGYTSEYDCTARKFFGGNYESYYGKLKKATGDYYYFLETKRKIVASDNTTTEDMDEDVSSVGVEILKPKLYKKEV